MTPVTRHHRAVPLLILALLILASAGRAGATSMFPNSLYDGGVLSRDVYTGDFNKDGIADLAVMSQGDPSAAPGELRTLLGNGDGTFRAIATYSLGVIGDTASWLVGGDLNGDGRTDLVADMFSPGPFKVFLSNGDGTFLAAPDVTGASNPRGVLGDFTGDSKLDLLLVRGTTTSTFEVLPGVGDGTFLPSPTGQMAEGGISGRLLVVDANADGKMDIVTGATTTGARTFLGNGNGTFSAVAAMFSVALTLPVLADFDRNGVLDLIVSTGNAGTSGQISMFRGNGNGTFQEPPAWQINLSFGAESMVSGDLNHDGWLDLIATGWFETDVFLGTGAGAVAQHETFNVGAFTFRMALGDFDRKDGLDLAVTAPQSLTVAVLLGDADGSLQRYYRNPTPVPLAAVPYAALSADINGDGVTDLAGAQCTGPGNCHTVAVSPGLATGGFGTAASFNVGLVPRAMLAEDVNGDLNLDLVVLNEESNPPVIAPGTVSILIGTGSGGMLPQIRYIVGYNPKRVAAGDLDNDGDLDLVVASEGLSGYPGGLSLLAGHANGSFSDQVPIAAPNVDDVAIGDFNGDGRLDLATLFRGAYPGPAAEVAINFGNGNLTFGPRQVVGQGVIFNSLAAGDLDSDGDLDLIATDGGDVAQVDGAYFDYGRSRVFRNNGSGVFSQTATLVAGVQPVDGRLQDLNDDGILDFWVINETSLDVALFAGKGDGTFGAPERVAWYYDSPMLIAQFDADPRPDLILSFYSDSNAVAILNIGASIPNIRMGPTPGLVSWTGVPLCGGYDVVKGDLALLRSGGFPVAITGCSHPGGTTQSFIDPTLPALGKGFFYIARAIKPSGDPGTYDDGPGQVAPRDAAIAMSALACP